MAHWSDQIAPSYLEDVMNVYAGEVGLEAFDVFPMLPVNKKIGLIAKIKKEDWLTIGNVAQYIREGAVESYGDDYRIEQQAYRCMPYAFHKDLTKDDAEESESIFDAVGNSSRFVVNRLKRILLKNLGTTFLNAANWPQKKTTFVAADMWSAATSDPIRDVVAAKRAISKITGYTPNKAIITGDIFDALQTNATLRNTIKITNDKIVTPELIKAAFGLDKLTILESVNEAATDLMYTKTMLLVYTPNTPSKDEPSAGYHITHRSSGYDGVKKTVGTRKIVSEIKNDAMRIEGEICCQPLIMGADLGYFLQNMI